MPSSLRQAGADLIFAPEIESIYPPGFDTTVEVGDLSKRWEGASRPGHLRAVATVVTILLNLAHPARAYFGEKDYQQLQVIRRMHLDLALPGRDHRLPNGARRGWARVVLPQRASFRGRPGSCPVTAARYRRRDGRRGTRRNRRAPARSGRARRI